MTFGRILGWCFVLAAIVMVSAETVMALGTGSYNGLATVEVWTLLLGDSPDFIAQGFSGGFWAGLGTLLMAMPAWAAFGVIGLMTIHLCRDRRKAHLRRLRQSRF